MKRLFTELKSQGGFTLIELMVVVAIIGLLSAVAVPNFKKYQAKSKVTEAKLQLSALYTAEQAFFSDYNIYHNCLPYMGFDPGPDSASRYYAIGFNTASTLVLVAHTAAQNSGLDAASCPQANAITAGGTAAVSAANATWFPAGKGMGGSIASAVGYVSATALGDQSAFGTMSFLAGAGGVVSLDQATFGAAGTSSYFTINQNKILLNVRNGY